MTVPSATSRTNEAAERLIEHLDQVVQDDHSLSLLDAALSEERRLERERIKERLPEVLAYHLSDVVGGDPDWSDFASRILDEVSR